MFQTQKVPTGKNMICSGIRKIPHCLFKHSTSPHLYLWNLFLHNQVHVIHPRSKSTNTCQLFRYETHFETQHNRPHIIRCINDNGINTSGGAYLLGRYFHYYSRSDLSNTPQHSTYATMWKCFISCYSAFSIIRIRMCSSNKV